MNIYRFPTYYEIAFSFREPAKDVDFMEKAIAKFSKVRVRSVLELASGLSPYLGEWDRRGYPDLGLDLGVAMIAAARRKARSRHPVTSLSQQHEFLHFAGGQGRTRLCSARLPVCHVEPAAFLSL